MAKYRIEDAGDGSFNLYHSDLFLVTFRCDTFRKQLECVATEWGFSTNWIGSMLRLFHKHHPFPLQTTKRTDFDRLVSGLGVSGIADYLRSKGLRVVKRLSVDDDVLIKFIEQQGYVVEGLVADCYYSSAGGVR